MDRINQLLTYIYNAFVYDGTSYLGSASVAFLIFWVLLRQRLAFIKIQPRNRTNGKIILNEVKNSILSLIVAAFVIWVLEIAFMRGKSGLFYNNFYQDINDYGWAYLLLSVFLLLVLEDTYFYWSHRMMHHPKVFNHVHKVHHLSIDPNPFTTYSFHPYEIAILFFGQVLVASIIPLHLSAVFAWKQITLLNSISIHLGYEIYPRWFTKFWLTKWKTPSVHHNMHHEKVKGNYALIFTWWDKLMGTEFLDYQAKSDALYRRKRI